MDVLAAPQVEFPAGPDALMFTVSGKPITPSVFGHKWRAAVETAGLPAGRVSRAPPLLRQPVDPARGERQDGAVASRPRQRGRDAGHLSHLWPDSDDRTRDAVDSVLAMNLRITLQLTCPIP